MAGTPIINNTMENKMVDKIKKVKAIKAVKDKFVAKNENLELPSEAVVEEKKKRGGRKVAKKPEVVVEESSHMDNKLVDTDTDAEAVVKKEKKVNLPGKYNKFMVFGYWLIENLNQKQMLVDTDSAFQQLQLFSSIPHQVTMFKNFFDDFKATQKLMKAAVKLHNKPVKQKKVKNYEVAEGEKPKAKPGRKPKSMVKLTTEQQTLIENIVHAANSTDSNLQMIDAKTVDSKVGVEVDAKTVDSKVGAEVDAKMEDEDEEELEVSPFEFNGKNYFIDSDSILYDVDTFEQIGKFINNCIGPL